MQGVRKSLNIEEVLEIIVLFLLAPLLQRRILLSCHDTSVVSFLDNCSDELLISYCVRMRDARLVRAVIDVRFLYSFNFLQAASNKICAASAVHSLNCEFCGLH
jgi:hypothetical protein